MMWADGGYGGPHPDAAAAAATGRSQPSVNHKSPLIRAIGSELLAGR